MQNDQGDDVGINMIEESKKLDEIEEFLMRWLYFFYQNNVDLVDESGFSFFYKNLNKLMNKSFTPKDYYKRQYHILKSRLDFLKNIN